MSVVDRARLEPLYHQVEMALLERIVSGQLAHGSQTPTEDELCAAFGVSRITIRQAMKNLVHKGYLVRHRGRGTFVREPTLTAGVRGLKSFSQEMKPLGVRVSARVLKLELLPATSLVAERLGLRVGEPVIVVRRLRLGDDQPIGLQTAHLTASRFPGLEHAKLSNRSLYQHLERYYNLHPLEAKETFWATQVNGEEARLLEVNDGTCGFKVERITSDAIGVFEFTTSIMRGDRYRIQWTLTQP